MEKVRICPSLKEKEVRRQTAFPDTLCGVVVATGCNIIRRRVASIGGSVFNSPAGRMEVQPKDDGAVSQMPVWYERLGVKPGCVWKWTPWFWVWGRGGTVREVREARQRLAWYCHSGRSASLWWWWWWWWYLYLASDLDIIRGSRSCCADKCTWTENTVDGVWTWGKAGCLWCQNRIIFFLVCTKTDESFSTQPYLLGQHLLCQQIIWRLCRYCRWKWITRSTEGWKKKSPAYKHSQNLHLEKHEMCFVIKLKTMLSSWKTGFTHHP